MCETPSDICLLGVMRFKNVFKKNIPDRTLFVLEKKINS